MCLLHAVLLLIGLCQTCRSTEITEGSSPEPAIVHIQHPLLSVRTPERHFYVHLKDDVHNDLVHFPGAPEGCSFRGDLLVPGPSKPEGTAAVTACHNAGTGPQVHALVIARDAVYFLQPSYGVFQGEADHVLIKGNLAAAERLCGFNGSHSISRRKREASKKNIEVGVFVDKAMADAFKSRAVLTNKVLAMMNQVQLIYNYKSLNPNFDLVIVKYQVLDADGPATAGGDIDQYLDNFCAWQCKKNSDKRWDHAIMLTGLDLFKDSGSSRNTKVLGLAWVNGMCRCMYSCTINEGSSFEAAFVIAHEMGHSLGMQHDGTGNDCDREKYIMSDRTGAGKTNWSPCSNKYLQRFLQRASSACLNDAGKPQSADLDLNLQSHLPGEAFPAEAQCKMALGEGHKPYRSSKSPFNDVCKELWCLDGSWATPAHPALDGTSCATGKYCRQGACVEKPDASPRSSTSPTTVRTSTTTARRRTRPTPHRVIFRGFFDDLWSQFSDILNFG